MATYDPVAQRIAVRVVYDGVACAGKTTNLRQLCALFAAQRSLDLYSPADANGRTLYFDWMQIMAGVVCGFPLLCQVVSVPGQVVLTPRRRYLLSTADVVVYVCESTPARAPAARAGLAVYDDLVRERGTALPLVVQANKQDTPGALDGAALLRALGREGTPVVEGIASDGVGVVDTFVAAVRTVARAIQARSETEVLRVRVRRAETAAETLAKVSEAKTDPEWAAEMILEEARAALLLEEATATAAAAPSRRAADAAAKDLMTLGDGPAVRPRDVREVPIVPVPPSADVPTGFIWPAHTGRATLRALVMKDLETSADGAVRCAAGGHVARTSVRARFPDGEAARQALVRRAREHAQLDRLLVRETVLVAQPCADGSCWIWTLYPELSTVASLLADRTATADILAAYGAAVVEVLRASLRHGFWADLTPRAFGVQQGLLRYAGELASDSPTPEHLSASIYGAIETITHAGADVKAFLDAFERGLERRLTPDERARAEVVREVLSRAVGVA